MLCAEEVFQPQEARWLRRENTYACTINMAGLEANSHHWHLIGIILVL